MGKLSLIAEHKSKKEQKTTKTKYLIWAGSFLSLEELDTVEKIESKLESKRYYEYRAYALLA